MRLQDIIRKTERNIRRRLGSALGTETILTPSEIRRAILGEVESRVVVNESGKRLHSGKLVVHLHPTTEALRETFATAFLKDNSLKSDIRRKIQEIQVHGAGNPEIVIELHKPEDQGLPGTLYKLDLVRIDQSRRTEIPVSILTIAKGSVEQPVYRLRKERILIGRLPEVGDLEGRTVRRNDVVFLDSGDSINSTVGCIHARIWFDSSRREFRIMDEASRYGTRLVRDGRSIEVPGGNPRGVCLRSGDEICLGQACMRFEILNSELEP